MNGSGTAVVLCNLGGPDAPESIAPFLKNFFMDPAIIRAPFFVRWMLSRWIAFTRSRGAAGQSYAQLGGRSPLLENTRAQARALAPILGPDFSVHVCMRYWHPMAPQVVREVAAQNPSRVILLALYPQFSTTTSASSFKAWDDAARAAGFSVPVCKLCCWPDDPGFVAASARLVGAAIARSRQETGRTPRLLFSAHGLPEAIIRDGDPYQWQCERTAQSVAATLGEKVDWVLCYQSRVGPMKWIGPATDDEIRRAGKDGVPVVIYPLAFVSEHVETLVELDIEYAHLAHESGVPHYLRVPTVMTEPEFIAGLARLAVAASTDSRETCGPGFCPQTFSACPCRKGA